MSCAQGFVLLGVVVGLRSLLLPATAEEDKAKETDIYVLKIAQDILNRFPNDAEAHFNLGRAHGRAGRYIDAIAAFERGLTLDPNRPDIYRALATLATRSDREEDAVEFLQEAIKLVPKAPNFHERLGLALLHLGRLDEALEAFKTEKELSPNDPYVCIYMGEIYLLQDRLEQARAALEQGLRLGPDIAQTYYSLAQVCAKQGDRQRAAELLSTFRRLKAQIERRADEIPKPEDAEQLTRAKSAAHRDAGRVFLLHNDLAGAEHHFRKAVEIDPKEVPCRAQLVDMFLRTNRNIHQALVLARSLVDLAPTAANYDLLSWALHENKRFDEAMEACRKAVELEPENATYRKRYQQFLDAKQAISSQSEN